jgi:type IV pilus assembly protein PilC
MTALHALETLAAQIKNTALRRELEAVTGSLAGGHGLSAAFEKTGFFPPFFTGLLKAGEESGRLETVLEQLAEHFEKQHDLEQKIRSATAYPLFVTAVALVVMGVMVLFVLPRFASIFASMGVEMPGAAAFILNTSLFLLKNRYLLPLFLLPLILAAAYFKTGHGRLRLDRLRLRLPLLQSFYRQALTARFARTMSMLLSSGIPLTAALELTGRVLDNRIAAHLLHRTCSAVKKGKTMAATLQSSGLFPEMLIEMIRVGEKTGELAKMLQQSAAHYERELSYLADRLGTLLEPLLLLVIGGVIGLMVYSIFTPMYQVFQMI